MMTIFSQLIMAVGMHRETTSCTYVLAMIRLQSQTLPQNVRLFAPFQCLIATVMLGIIVAPAQSAILDAQGNVYIVSSPRTFTAPTTPNAFQSTVEQAVCGSISVGGLKAPLPCSHGYIQKVSPDGKQLLAATYLGGNSEDSIASVATDAAGNIYVIGSTGSTDFPVTSDAFQTQPGRAFLSIFSPDCSRLLYSSYIGFGNPAVILIDQSQRVVLAGSTQPSNFPATAPVTSNNDPKYRDSFVVRFNLERSNLDFALEIGGTMDDVVQAAILDSVGNIYLSGYTSSTPLSARFTTVTPYTTFPVTPGAYRHMAGSANVFVVKLNPAGNIVYSTVLGGSRSDTSNGLGIDPEGSVYLTGHTESVDFPITDGAFRSTFSRGFALKLRPDATGLVYSTFLGTDEPGPPAVDASGVVRVAGQHNLTVGNFPATPDAAQPCAPDTAPYISDYYLELNDSGSQLLYATLIPAAFRNSPTPILALSGTGQLYLSSANGFFSVVDAAARPAQGVTCIANAASYRRGGVAPGEIVALFGPEIGPAHPSAYQLIGGTIGASLGGVQVTMNGYPAPLLYVSANQINAVVPFEVAGQQNALVQVTSAGTALSSVSVPIVDNAPGVFTLDGSGGGQAAVINQDGTINGDAHPAPRGSIVSIFVTGAGMMRPVPSDGSLGTGKASVVLSTAATMLAIPAAISYSGDVPGEVEGLVQINFQIPRNLPETGYIALDLGFGTTNPSLVFRQAEVWLNVE